MWYFTPLQGLLLIAIILCSFFVSGLIYLLFVLIRKAVEFIRFLHPQNLHQSKPQFLGIFISMSYHLGYRLLNNETNIEIHFQIRLILLDYREHFILGH